MKSNPRVFQNTRSDASTRGVLERWVREIGFEIELIVIFEITCEIRIMKKASIIYIIRLMGMHKKGKPQSWKHKKSNMAAYEGLPRWSPRGHAPR